MKHYILHVKSMLIGLLLLTSGVVMANSVMVTGAPTKSETVCTELSAESAKTGEVLIEILSRLETYELGKKLFGGDKGLTALGSGFLQKAPGSTWDSNPELDTQTPPALANNPNLILEDEIRTEIIKLIHKPDLMTTNIDKAETYLHFTINQKHEIIVLTVDTEDTFMDQFFKSRLNYKKLSAAEIGGRYSVKVTITNS